ncbi:Phage integrase family protein [Caulifigura coniformis]|uniref:Phage integrase family protein n=1 Tax=Caulifigura coniformis TaxID=2527983 RepID=A0A517SHV3_9PLAN|nr:site-specific integrase [Caulifigura coniformis]QDT55708.1 Phage integrase family protein [Caulifigura coniformis]
MASISSDRNGTRRLQFIDKAKKRRTLYLGPVSLKTAQTIALRVEALVTASIMGTEPDRAAAEWAAQVSDDLARKLARFGLTSERKKQEVEVVTLGLFLRDWFEPRSKAKENTKVVWAQVRRNLVGFFGDARDIATITSSEAVAFRDYLIRDQDLGGESVKKRIQVARMFFKEAVAKKLIGENPFASVPMPKSGMRKRQRQEYVSSEIVDKLLPHCSRVLRLYVVLARYGGLRCPSETGSLRWEDLDWQNLRMTITSPKTEAHEGGESRQSPIFARVLDELREWRAEAPKNAVFVLDGLRTQRQAKPDWKSVRLGSSLECAIRAAGLEPWPKMFNSLRGSCETDLLAMGFQNHVVAAWLGHSVKVQESNYASVRPEDFDRAAQMTSQAAAQKTAHALPLPSRTGSSLFGRTAAHSLGFTAKSRKTRSPKKEPAVPLRNRRVSVSDAGFTDEQHQPPWGGWPLTHGPASDMWGWSSMVLP